MAKLILIVSLIVLVGFIADSQGATEGFDEVKGCLQGFVSELSKYSVSKSPTTSAERLAQLEGMQASILLMEKYKDCFARANALEGKITAAEKKELDNIFPDRQRK